MVALAALSAYPEPQRLVYTGELGTLYRIAVVNLLLSILTLGFYRFWGRARLRRYLWSSMVLDGDPFEWTGTGWEMCRSFLIVAALLFLFYLPVYALSLAGPAYATALLVYQVAIGALALFLVGVATVLGLRYRLSRSRWRGIRGDLEASPWPYAWRHLGWSLLYAPTLGLIHPFATVALRRWLINHMRLGDRRPECHASGGSVFPAFLGSIALAAALYVLFMVAVFGAAMASIVAAVMVDPETSAGGAIGMVTGIAMAVLLLAAWPCVSAVFHASLFRHLADGTEAAGLKLVTHVSGGGLFWLRFSNLLILGATLGIGLPIVWHRRARFLAQNAMVIGLEGAGQVRQAVGRPTRTSEGLLEVLDLGAV